MSSEKEKIDNLIKTTLKQEENENEFNQLISELKKINYTVNGTTNRGAIVEPLGGQHQYNSFSDFVSYANSKLKT